MVFFNRRAGRSSVCRSIASDVSVNVLIVHGVVVVKAFVVVVMGLMLFGLGFGARFVLFAFFFLGFFLKG